MALFQSANDSQVEFPPRLTKAQIAELQKVLPKCIIKHDAKK
jgi:hypothetical protein